LVSFISLESSRTNGKTVLCIKCAFHFSPELLFETCFASINTRILRVTLEMSQEAHAAYSVCYRCLLLTKTNECRQISVKFPQYKISRKPVRSLVVICGQTDKHGEANRRVLVTLRCEGGENASHVIYACVTK
jgi:hypothetical protein